jgi:polyhydroxyalkanoic acid synthase PhaR subunit
MSQASQSSTPDFSRLWADWLSQTERQWNSLFNDMMSTDQFSQSLGGAMDFYLAMQKTFAEQMGRYLNNLNMPSRSDILALNTRLLEVENRLAKIESLLTVQARNMANGGAESGDAPRPSRTRKPPAAADA